MPVAGGRCADGRPRRRPQPPGRAAFEDYRDPAALRPYTFGSTRSSSATGARDQLHPLVVPQDSQTKHDPAGRIRTPQVEQ